MKDDFYGHCNEKERFLYAKTYAYIKGYASGRRLANTLKALPLCISAHDGQYRKKDTIINKKTYKTPYCTHCLKVCNTLITLNLPMEREDMDILLASALLHDVLEDQAEKFPAGGTEFMTKYELDPRILETVRTLSKHKGATKEEIKRYFMAIRTNPYALMVKLSDRSHNSETMYVMSDKKIEEYIGESKEMLKILTGFGKSRYPELSDGIMNMTYKINSLIDLTEALTNRDKPSNVTQG